VVKSIESTAITTGWKYFWSNNFSKKNSRVSKVRCFANLHGVLPKFCFREKWRQKFQQWRKIYCLVIFQMNYFRFFFMLQACAFQHTSIKSKNCNKRMWFFQSDILRLISCILMSVEDGIWNFSLQRNLKLAPLKLSFLTCIASGRQQNSKIQVKCLPLKFFLHKAIFLFHQNLL